MEKVDFYPQAYFRAAKCPKIQIIPKQIKMLKLHKFWNFWNNSVYFDAFNSVHITETGVLHCFHFG